MRALLERQNRLSMPVNVTKCTIIGESQAYQQMISLYPDRVSIREAWMRQAGMDGSLGKFLKPQDALVLPLLVSIYPHQWT